jgi:hypothetical protein
MGVASIDGNFKFKARDVGPIMELSITLVSKFELCY